MYRHERQESSPDDFACYTESLTAEYNNNNLANLAGKQICIYNQHIYMHARLKLYDAAYKSNALPNMV